MSFGITVDVLQAANPGVTANALAIGSSLTIPGFDGLSGTLTTHSMEPGETLDSLALRLGLKRATPDSSQRHCQPGIAVHQRINRDG